jgi:hypothetical protein
MVEQVSTVALTSFTDPIDLLSGDG